MKNPLRLVDKRGLTILLGAFVLVTLVTVIIIVLSVSIRNRETSRVEAERRQNERQALTNSTSFGMEDFYLDPRDPDTGIVYPARRPRRYWTDDEVEFYWIDPAEAHLGDLDSQNDALIMNALGLDGTGD